MSFQLKKTLSNLSDGALSPSAYDTAWIARIPDPHDHTRPLFENSLQWILDNQLEDGSWGESNIEYYFDRIISTLSCIIALKNWDLSDENIQKGVSYINKNLVNLLSKTEPTVGFEIIFPSLIKKAKELGLKLDYSNNAIEYFQTKGESKLKLIPINYIYSQPTTLLHSLEALDEGIDFDKILKFQSENGSFLNSPASTAFVYIHTQDSKALGYIESLLEQFGNSVPVNYPLDIFNRLWILDYIHQSGLQDELKNELEGVYNYLHSHWSDDVGITWSRYVGIPDLDDTSVAFRMFNSVGREVSLDAFKKFYDNNRFYCFKGEAHSGISHLSNLLKAMSYAKEDDFVKNAKDIASKFIFSRMHEGFFWDDKWHTSPIYVTTSVINSIKNVEPFIAKKSLEWLVNQQKDDGSWGSDEESAYAIMNLHANQNLLEKSVFSKAISKAKQYRDEREEVDLKSTQWIDKVLYTDSHVVEVAVSCSDYILNNY